MHVLVNQHAKLYSRIVILLLLTSTAFLYYVANRKEFISHKSPSIYKKFPSLNFKAQAGRHAEIKTNYAFGNKTEGLSWHSKKLEISARHVYRFGSKIAEIKLAVVLCGGRIKQTIVTLKSAIIFSRRPLHFVIIVDDYNEDFIKNELLKWPTDILKRLSFEIHPIYFPAGNEGEEWKKLFKLCASERLFLPSLMHHIDSLLYVDTDVLFIRPIEDLWQYFYKMNESQIAALCPEHEEFTTGWYNRFARHPYYEPLGVNSGVMLMNLTRMRSFQWESYLHPIMNEYKMNIVWGDQDVINIIFHFHPDKLLIFPCEWNYRPDHCMYSSVCKTAKLNGIAVIHGNRGVFDNYKQPAFKAVYEVMANFRIGDDLQTSVINPIIESLKKASNTNCGKLLFKNIFSSQHIYATEILKDR